MNTTAERQHYGGLITTRTTVECSPLLDASQVNLKAKTRSTNWHKEPSVNKEFGMDEMAIPATGNREDYWSTQF